MKWEVEFASGSVIWNTTGMGCTTGAHNNQIISFFINGRSNYKVIVGDNTTSTSTPYDTNKHKVVIDRVNQVAKFDDEDLTVGTITATPIRSLYLFAMHFASGMSNRMNANVYSSKIYENGSLVQDLVPCYRKSDNEIGMYDLVTQTFFTNSGSGTFTKGQDV